MSDLIRTSRDGAITGITIDVNGGQGLTSVFDPFTATIPADVAGSGTLNS